MHIIRSRDKPDPGYRASSKTLCFRCMEPGTLFVFIDGRRKYACPEHFRLWQQACLRSERDRDRILGGQD